METHVQTLQRWRDQGKEAEFIQDLIRGVGEPKAKTARELLLYLCDGSPSSRTVLQQILDGKVIEKLDKAKWKHHQKLIVYEGTPGCGFYVQALCRVALIDARMMHASLTNKAKGELCDLFNDPRSSSKVLIIMFDVGAVGLNLHIACDRVLAIAISKSEGQNAQASGRVNRVSKHTSICLIQKYFWGSLLIVISHSQ